MVGASLSEVNIPQTYCLCNIETTGYPGLNVLFFQPSNEIELFRVKLFSPVSSSEIAFAS